MRSGIRRSGETTRRSASRLSLGAKLACIVLGVLSAVFLALYLGLARYERERLVSSKAAAGRMLVDIFVRGLQAPLQFQDDDAIAAEMRSLDGQREIRSVFVWAATAEPIAHLGELHLVQRPVGVSERVDDTGIALARPVVSRSGRAVGEVLIELSLESELASYRRTRADLLVSAAAMALSTSALLIVAVRREIVAPLQRVATAAAAIGKGDLAARADGSRRDEIGDLGAAFNQMAMSLEDRELRLQSVTESLRELVDHMRQAIAAFDSSGTIVSEASREARRLFGSDDLKGRSARELLYANTPEFNVEIQAFDEWRALAFGTSPDRWEEVAALAPAELLIGPARTPVTLEFRPIIRRGRVLHVMLLASDVSKERHLERVAQTKEEEYERRLRAVRRLLLGGSQALVAFVESASGRLIGCKEMIASCKGDVLPTQTIDALFRSVHTVRGEARAFNMRDLERNAECLEQTLDDLRAEARGDGHALSPELRAQLIEAIRAADQTLREERDFFAEASPIGRAIFTQTTVQIEDLSALEAYAAPFGGRLAALVKRLRARPFGETAAGVLESAPSWASFEGKRVNVLVEQGETAVDPALASVLPGVLAHLVRNAIAHGIEASEERKAAGKTDQGLIRLCATKTAEGGTDILVEDDGRGLDIEALHAVAPDAAMPVDQVIFAPGVSTRNEPDELAGRGVGLDAVRTELASVGYVISVATERARFTRFTIVKDRDSSRRVEGSAS